MQFQSLGGEDPLEEGTATLAGRIPWMENLVAQTCTPMFTAALPIRGKKWEPPRSVPASG